MSRVLFTIRDLREALAKVPTDYDTLPVGLDHGFLVTGIKFHGGYGGLIVETDYEGEYANDTPFEDQMS